MSEMHEPCPPCALNNARPSSQLAVWAWFDLVVNGDNYPLSDPPTTADAADLLDSASTQAEVQLTPEDYARNLQGMHALIGCYRLRQMGGCALARALSDR